MTYYARMKADGSHCHRHKTFVAARNCGGVNVWTPLFQSVDGVRTWLDFWNQPQRRPVNVG